MEHLILKKFNSLKKMKMKMKKEKNKMNYIKKFLKRNKKI